MRLLKEKNNTFIVETNSAKTNNLVDIFNLFKVGKNILNEYSYWYRDVNLVLVRKNAINLFHMKYTKYHL